MATAAATLPSASRLLPLCRLPQGRYAKISIHVGNLCLPIKSPLPPPPPLLPMYPLLSLSMRPGSSLMGDVTTSIATNSTPAVNQLHLHCIMLWWLLSASGSASIRAVSWSADCTDAADRLQAQLHPNGPSFSDIDGDRTSTSNVVVDDSP